MAYLLDTNVCIALLNGRPASVLERSKEVALSGQHLFVSSLSVFELWYGAEEGGRVEINRERVNTFLRGEVSVVMFDVEDSRVAGMLRVVLEKVGKPIGAYDLLIAAQAVRHGMTLVTSNLGEFSRVAKLRLEDWAKRS